MNETKDKVVRKVKKVSCWKDKDGKICYKVVLDDDSIIYVSDYKLFQARNNFDYYNKGE